MLKKSFQKHGINLKKQKLGCCPNNRSFFYLDNAIQKGSIYYFNVGDIVVNQQFSYNLVFEAEEGCECYVAPYYSMYCTIISVSPDFTFYPDSWSNFGGLNCQPPIDTTYTKQPVICFGKINKLGSFSYCFKCYFGSNDPTQGGYLDNCMVEICIIGNSIVDQHGNEDNIVIDGPFAFSLISGVCSKRVFCKFFYTARLIDNFPLGDAFNFQNWPQYVKWSIYLSYWSGATLQYYKLYNFGTNYNYDIDWMWTSYIFKNRYPKGLPKLNWNRGVQGFIKGEIRFEAKPIDPLSTGFYSGSKNINVADFQLPMATTNPT